MFSAVESFLTSESIKLSEFLDSFHCAAKPLNFPISVTSHFPQLQLFFYISLIGRSFFFLFYDQFVLEPDQRNLKKLPSNLLANGLKHP